MPDDDALRTALAVRGAALAAGHRAAAPPARPALQELGRAAPRRRGRVLESRRTAGAQLADRTWGERNTTRIQHPLSLAVPSLGRWLDVPPHPLPGDANMPRVQGPDFGASERLVVSPGHEETGIFHMPGGAERPPALTRITRRASGLGGREADAVPPRAGGPSAGLAPAR